jgi:hypothetical protein
MDSVSRRHSGLERGYRALQQPSKLRLSTICSAPQQVPASQYYETESLPTQVTLLSRPPRLPTLVRRPILGMTMMKARFAFQLLLTLTSSQVLIEELHRLTDRRWGSRSSGRHKLVLWESNTFTRTLGVPLDT